MNVTNSNIIFETERVIVRPYVFDQDAENFYLLNSDADVMRYIRPVKNRVECDAFLKEIIKAYQQNPQIGRWAAFEKSGKNFVGSFAIIPIEGTSDIQLGYALLKQDWGKGFASEMTAAALDYYFRITDADHIYAIAETANLASHQVLLKNGFLPDGIKKEGGKELQRFIYRKNHV